MSLLANAHEEIIAVNDRASGLSAIVAIHSTRLGPARGGTRIRRYDNPIDAMNDALTLSYHMSLKWGFYDMPYGGAKAIIIDDDEGQDPEVRERRLLAFGRAIERWKGRFSTGPDYGTFAKELAIIRRVTDHIVGDTEETLNLVSEGTSAGVLTALMSAWQKPGADQSFGILGLGKVGGRLAACLAALGAKLSIADINHERGAELAERYGAELLSPAELLAKPLDVLMPCAVGGVINDGNVDSIACKVICGSANQQLADPSLAQVLQARGILYVPDFVANAGGALVCVADPGPGLISDVRSRISKAVEDLCAASSDSGQTLYGLAVSQSQAKLGS